MSDRNIPVGTLHDQERNGPVTVLRDYDTLLIDRWRLPLEEVRRLRNMLNNVLLDLVLARDEMASAPVTVCTYCGEPVVLAGGSWTTDDGTAACTDTSAPFVPHKPKEG